MSLIRSVQKSRAQEREQIEIIDYKEAGKLLGLAPKTVANGGAGTSHLQHRTPSGTVRYFKHEVLALRDEWYGVNSAA